MGWTTQRIGKVAAVWLIQVWLVQVWLYQGCAAAETPQHAPSGIDAIWAYAGTWKTETERFNTAHSKAGHEAATLKNVCWKNGGYLACNQYVDGDSKTLLVFTFDSKDHTYTSYPIPLDGQPAGKGRLLIEGNVWTFPWQIQQGDKTTWYRVVNVFASADRIEFRQEFSEDNAHWTVMAKGVDTRTGSGSQAPSQ